MCRTLLALCGGIWFVGISFAAPNPEMEPRKDGKLRDADGVVLPEGAVARIGSSLFTHGPNILWLEFSPNGSEIATFTATGLRIHDVQTCKLRCEIPFEPGLEPNGLHWSAQVIMTSSRSAVHLFDAKVGKSLWNHQTPDSEIIASCLSKNGTLAAICSARDGVFVFLVESGEIIRRLKVPVLELVCVGLDFSPDGRYLAGATEHGAILWNLASEKAERFYPTPGNNTQEVRFSPNSRKLLTIGKKIGCWATDVIEAWPEFTPLELQNFRIQFSNDEKQLLWFDEKGRIVRCNAETGLVKEGVGTDLEKLMNYRLSPDEKWIAATLDSRLYLYSVATGKPHLPPRSLPPFESGIHLGQGSVVLRNEEGQIFDAAFRNQKAEFSRRKFTVPADAVFSTCGQFVAHRTAPNSNILELRDARTGKELHHLTSPTEEALAEQFQFSPDGSFLVVTHVNETMTFWDTQTGRSLGDHQVPRCTYLEFSADRRLLLTGNTNWVRCWELSTQRVRFHSAVSGQSYAKFSPDSRSIYGRVNNEIVVLSTRDGKEIRRIVPGVNIHEYAISPDQRFLLVTYGEGNRIRVFDLRSTVEESFIDLDGHAGYISVMSFDSDGKHLLTAAKDGTVLFWDVSRWANLPKVETPGKSFRDSWDQLGDEDGEVAGNAMVYFERRPKEAVAFLAERCLPVPRINSERLKLLVRELDHPQFAVRNKARKELELHGELAEIPLRELLKQREVSNHIAVEVNQLLAKITGPETVPERIRMYRAIEMLEHMETPEARQLLETLAKGAEESRITREAIAALTRCKAHK